MQPPRGPTLGPPLNCFFFNLSLFWQIIGLHRFSLRSQYHQEQSVTAKAWLQESVTYLTVTRVVQINSVFRSATSAQGN